jgi:hypothetical protein
MRKCHGHWRWWPVLVEVEDPTDDVDCLGVEFLPEPIGGGGPLLCRVRELGKLILGLAEDTLTMGTSKYEE